MFQSAIDMWVARYISSDVDVDDVVVIQEKLKEDLRETVPINLIYYSVNRVQKVRNN